MSIESDNIQRELFITPSVKWFLERCGKTDYVMQLTRDVYEAVSGEMEKSDCIRCIPPYFMLKVLRPSKLGRPERVLVWNAHEDGGAIFDTITPKSILKKAMPWGMGLQ